MKFIVSSSQLLKQLQVLGGVINSNNTLPILDNFLFEISENKLNFEKVPDRFGHDLRYSLDTNKIKKQFNWSPKNKLFDYFKKSRILY